MSKFLKDVLNPKGEVDLSQAAQEVNEIAPVEIEEEETEVNEHTDEDQNSEMEEETEEVENEEEANESSDDGEEEDDSEENAPNPFEEEKAKLEKRYKDAQAEMTRKNQENIELKKRIADLEEASKKESDDAWMNNEDVDDQVKARFSEYDKRIADMEAQRKQEIAAKNQELWDEKCKPMKEAHADFSEVIALVDESYNDEIAKQFADGGSTPEAAYAIGKKLKLRNMSINDPEGYAEYLRDLQQKKSDEKKVKTKKELKKVTTGSKTPNGRENNDVSEPSLTKQLFRRK